MDRFLVLNRIRDGYMDPGYPGFLYTGSGNYEESSSPESVRGTLKKIPIMSCLAAKMKVIFEDDGIDNEPIHTSRRVIQLAKVTGSSIDEITKNSLVYLGGVFTNKKELKELVKKYKNKTKSVTFIEEISNFYDDSIRKEVGNNMVSLVRMDGRNIIKLLAPSDYISSFLK